MTEAETKQLFVDIYGIYTEKFKYRPEMIKSWQTRLANVPYAKAHKALDDWVGSEKGSYVPDLAYFVRKTGESDRSNTGFIDNSYHKFDLQRNRKGEYSFDENGRAFAWYLEDEEGREYGNTLGEPYYFDSQGRIVRKNENGIEVVIVG